MPLVSSNLCAARMRPRLPSLIRSAEGDALVLVFLGDRDDEAEVAADQLVEALGVADANALRERDLLRLRNQRVAADLAEVVVERTLVGRGGRACRNRPAVGRIG